MLPTSAVQEAEDFLPRVYTEVRRLAAEFLRLEGRGHTLQPTALVHEAYLRLLKQDTAGWSDSRRFVAVLSRLMRRVLIEHARRRRAFKRGGHWQRTSLDEIADSLEDRGVDVSLLEEALSKLQQLDERKTRVVELRVFWRMSTRETSRLLGVPVRTVERDWTMARAWLRAELTRQSDP